MVVTASLIASLATWLIASAAGSAAGRGLFELGTAPYWGLFLAVAQGLVLRGRGVPYFRWVLWSAGGWVVGALVVARLISAFVRAVVAPVFSVIPPDLVTTVAIFSVLGAGEWAVLRPHMPSAFTWVALNMVAGADINLLESPIRVVIFALVEATAGVIAAEAAVGAALGAIYAAIMAPQMVRIGPAERASNVRHGPRPASLP